MSRRGTPGRCVTSRLNVIVNNIVSPSNKSIFNVRKESYFIYILYFSIKNIYIIKIHILIIKNVPDKILQHAKNVKIIKGRLPKSAHTRF